MRRAFVCIFALLLSASLLSAQTPVSNNGTSVIGPSAGPASCSGLVDCPATNTANTYTATQTFQQNSNQYLILSTNTIYGYEMQVVTDTSFYFDDPNGDTFTAMAGGAASFFNDATTGDIITQARPGNRILLGSGTPGAQPSTVQISGGGANVNGTFSVNGVAVAPNVQTANGWCSGTATSSTTIALFGLGELTTSCTGTPTSNYGLLMPRAGTLSNLTVRCGAQGVSTSSGVFTIYDIPSGGYTATATPLTVTYGRTAANTVLQDTTHTYAFNAGDQILVEFTTQSSETLGACSASFNY